MTPPSVATPSVVGAHERSKAGSCDKPVKRIEVSEEKMREAQALLSDPDTGVWFARRPASDH
jgi:hypothetical protein